jgi:hypothetical protein
VPFYLMMRHRWDSPLTTPSSALIGGEAWLQTSANPPPPPSSLSHASIAASTAHGRRALCASAVTARPDNEPAVVAQALLHGDRVHAHGRRAREREQEGRACTGRRGVGARSWASGGTEMKKRSVRDDESEGDSITPPCAHARCSQPGQEKMKPHSVSRN